VTKGSASPRTVLHGRRTRAANGVDLAAAARRRRDPEGHFVNIRDTEEFVVNLATLPLAHALHRTAFEFASDVDEFTAVGVEKEASAAVRPPRIKGVPISLECKLDRIIPMAVGENVVFGQVVCFNIRGDVYLEGARIEIGARLEPAAPIDKSHPEAHGVVEQYGNFPCRRGDRFGLAETSRAISGFAFFALFISSMQY
jgi:flavin reductase (DIM6/NTAB) family NADH-FMN oxidoreductase RutF